MKTETVIQSSDHLIQRAIEIASEGRKKRVVVAAAQDIAVIDAVAQAEADGFVSAVLVGDKKKIEQIASEATIDISKLDIIDEPDVPLAAQKAVMLASGGEADAIMKGFLPTSALLKTLLDKQYNLRGKNTLSHCALLDIPGYHKLLNMTDGGMVVSPDVDQKLQILENALLVGRALGLSPVKVAVSGAYDRVIESCPYMVSDRETLVPRALEEFSDIEIESPLPFDSATSAEAARKSGNCGKVAGDADIFLVNSIEECNIIAKSLIQFAGAVFAGVIVGAKVPVSLVSRSDTVKNKKTSLAIAALIADYYSEQNIWGSNG